MKSGKSYLLPLLAVLTLAAVAAYEFYWIKDLYKTRRDTAESTIRVSITWAEMEERSLRSKLDGRNIIVTSRLRSSDNIRVSKIVTTKMAAPGDSIPESITVSNIGEPLNLDDIIGDDSKTDIHVMDSILTHRLDSLALPLSHRLVLIKDDEAIDEAISPGYVSSEKDGYITMPSIINKGANFDLYTEPLLGCILSGMKGVLGISAGILLILALVFWLLMRALRKQRELDEMKSDFTSNMTHELKTPIAVAYAANDAMLVYGLDKNPEKREEYLKVTRESLEKLNGMVEQILSMSMENRESLVLNLSRTELRPLLETAAAQARLSATKPCEITVDVTPETLTANIDAALMSSVISTLLDNAVKYSGEKVHIDIKAEQKDGHVQISVTDDGIGIDPDKQAHIFEKFYRVPTGDVHDIKGYGIGLFFARTIVEKHGGHITVHSEPGKGSSFLITLPTVILNEVKNL